MKPDPSLREFQPPTIPTRLREDAIAAAQAALASRPRSDVWARLLGSPAARLAWAASLAILAGALALFPGGEPSRGSVVSETPPSDPEIASIARLPRIDERALAALEGDHP